MAALLLEVGLCLGWAVQQYRARQPPPARAECRDGTISHSRHRPGTCAHHHGVRRWITP